MSKSIYALNILQTTELKKLMGKKTKKMFVDLNEIRILKKCIDETSGLKNDSNFHIDEIDSVLCISFTEKNKTDLHESKREIKGIGADSNKTHIDVTSGAAGLSPAQDFFEDVQPGERKTFPVLINSENIKEFGGQINQKNKWINDSVIVKGNKPRNKSNNPGIQLTEKNCILKLRETQDFGHSLIFIKKKDIANDDFFYSINKNLESKEKENTENASSKIRSRKPVDPKLREKIEKYGVKESIKFLSEKGYEVVDVSTPKLARQYGLEEDSPGYDQIALKEDKEYQIEVKSTQKKGIVFISHNELEKGALNKVNWRLLVVSEIKEKNDEVHGGEITIYKISKKDLLSKFLNKIVLIRNDLTSCGLFMNPSYEIRLDSDFLSETLLD